MDEEPILIVDDDAVIRRARPAIIEREEHEVIALDGAFAPLAVPDRLTPPSRTVGSCCDEIVGDSLEMQRVFRRIERVAPTRATVLVTGESGTGKEMVATAVHRGSPRAARPFVALSCAALSETLLESELFGHERGSFTGADKQRRGRIEQADGGTLFLDEIGEIAPSVQVKLLRVLQERAFERVGGSKTVRVDVRFVAATNRDLKELVAQGKFREDLFYRLNVVNLHVPVLRERRSDIPALALHFLQKYGPRHGSSATGFSDAALELLEDCAWPGNVRQLENAIEHAVVFASGERVEPSHLPADLQAGPDPHLPPRIPGSNLLELERYAILKTMEAAGGSTRKAAALLGVSIRKIQYRLSEYEALAARPVVQRELHATRRSSVCHQHSSGSQYRPTNVRCLEISRSLVQRGPETSDAVVRSGKS